MNWNQVIEGISPYIVSIETPSGSGTGFLCLYNTDKTVCGIATALHVIDHANQWQQPIRITHHLSKQILFLKEAPHRIIFPDWRTDSAIILVPQAGLPFPEKVIELLPLDKPLSIGNEVGWLGFPAIEPNTLCFFSGNISARQEFRAAYLIDGVSIHGVSGGPVLHLDETDGLQIVGIVSAYRANRVTGEPLPGLLYAQDVSHFHDVVKQVRSLEEAFRKQQELERQQKEIVVTKTTPANSTNNDTPLVDKK